ncbi:MAG TPA: hypothetical protein HPP80_10665 [Rhodospirillaceae bacterium]|nr:hypothetical protein [Rhodospirillaceae bacterium]
MEWDLYLRTFLALLLVLGLITGAAWVARKSGLLLGHVGPRQKRRLSVVESLPLDGRRRLLLVRRDDSEHLLLVGGGTDVIIEQGALASAEINREIPPSKEARP